MPTAKLVSITPNYVELLKCACSKPYGRNVSMKTINDHIITAGHLSVLEHCYASFEVECSVAVLGQLTRHRHLSFTCQSARGCEFDEMVVPAFIFEEIKRRYDKDVTEADKEELRKEATQALLAPYKEALAEGFPQQDARYFLPQGIKTKLVVTGNFRAWFEYLPKRLCKRAMPEHREVAEAILAELKKAAPEIFDRNFMNCGVSCKEKGCEFK